MQAEFFECVKKNEKVIFQKIPEHIAVIMDGNGRWAKQQGKERVFGHRHAVTAVREITEACAEIGVQYLTLYTFSAENWARPKEEVDALMSLLVSVIFEETETLLKNNVRLDVIGDTHELPSDCLKSLREAMDKTSSGTGLCLLLALNYGGRKEITEAVKNIAESVQEGKILPKDIDEQSIQEHLYTKNIPDPELMIRTGGEMRISNFLLWQIAYSEIYFSPVLWPDFRKKDIFEALNDYQTRERRFGKISEQLNV